MVNVHRSYDVAITYDDVKRSCKSKDTVDFCYSIIHLISRNNEDSTPAYNRLKELYRKGKIRKYLINKITIR